MVKRVVALLSACGAVTLVGCEYEFKDEHAQHHRGVEVVVAENPRVGENTAMERLPPTELPVNVRPVLAPGKDVSGQADLPPKVKSLNLSELIESGELAVTSNVPNSRDLSNVFDEIDDTLVKSEGINPFKVTFQFNSPRTIRAVRVLSTYSDYGLGVEPAGAERLTVDTVIDGQWATVTWPEGIKCSSVAVEVLRKVRDNFVHLNEVEIYE